MIDTTNPAGRLYALLEIAAKGGEQEQIGVVWKRVFALDEKAKDVDIIERIVALYKLSKDCQSIIMNQSELKNKTLYMSPFDSIDRAIMNTALTAGWAGSKNHLTGEVMASLRFCADALSEHYAEESLSKTDLEKIIEDVGILFATIEQSNLSDEARSLLLTELARIQHAIQHYRINGAKGLKEALQGVVGAVIVNQELMTQEAKESPEVFEQVVTVLDTMNKFTATALRVQQLGQDTIKLIAPLFGAG